MAIYLGDKIVSNISNNQKPSFIINVTCEWDDSISEDILRQEGIHQVYLNNVTADKTYEEIKVAYEAGQSVFVYINNCLFPLMSPPKSSSMAYFYGGCPVEQFGGLIIIFTYNIMIDSSSNWDGVLIVETKRFDTSPTSITLQSWTSSDFNV